MQERKRKERKGRRRKEMRGKERRGKERRGFSRELTANRACAGPLEDKFSLKAEHRS